MAKTTRKWKLEPPARRKKPAKPKASNRYRLAITRYDADPKRRTFVSIGLASVFEGPTRKHVERLFGAFQTVIKKGSWKRGVGSAARSAGGAASRSSVDA